MRSKFNGKFWWDMTEQEHQQFPGDYEAQVGQGPMTLHSEEHFGQSDRGILMIRRMLGEQLDAMAAGRDPIGVSFDQNARAGRIRGGKFHSRGLRRLRVSTRRCQGEAMVDFAPQVAVQADAAARPSARRYYVLALLTVVYALNFLDRTIFNVLIEPIKKEFTLSDTTMGLLAGFGFVLFYSLIGIPIARVADRLNRRNIVAIAFAFWSAMTFLCGMAQSVTTLALARIGVGIGESAGTPASQSMVADLFDKNERPRALGVYAIGTYLGVFLGYFIGGYVNQHYGWRMAFFTAGAARHRACRGAVADGVGAEARRHGRNLYAGADRTDARLSRLATDLRHRADRLLPHHLHQLRHLGVDPAVSGAGASSEQRRNRHLCRHLQGPVRDGGHAGRRPRGGADQPPRRSLETVGAGDHVGPRRPGVRGVHADA